MERANRILQNQRYQEYLKKNEAAEVDRSFCCHNMSHFLDVARIAMILNGQEQLDIPKDMIYGAALLHDIGRFLQYQDNIPHEKASAMLAPDILTECGYNEEEKAMILSAIETHRDKEIAVKKNLNGILYRADKWSRPCFACKMEAECMWKNDKKNLQIVW